MFSLSMLRVDESLTSMFGDMKKQADGLIGGISSLPGQVTSAIESVKASAGSVISQVGGLLG